MHQGLVGYFCVFGMIVSLFVSLFVAIPRVTPTLSDLLFVLGNWRSYLLDYSLEDMSERASQKAEETSTIPFPTWPSSAPWGLSSTSSLRQRKASSHSTER